MSDSVPYTRRPRPTLWLLRSGDLEVPGHPEVEVRAIYISKNPITNEELEAYLPDRTRATTAPGAIDPAANVTFAEAEEYCRRYSEASGKPFRLPTETEWEFACRAESSTRYFWGDDPAAGDAYCWDADVAGGSVRAVEQGKANEYGLYDMLGNVWEWTSSAWAEPFCPTDSPPSDAPTAQGDAQGDRVLRGGSFRTSRADLTCSIRKPGAIGASHDDVGFRIVRFL